MKLTQKQYSQITELIRQKGLDIDHFSFVKKKGWIHITYMEQEGFFSFFRRKHHTLNPATQQLEMRTSYELKYSNGEMVSELDWEGILTELAPWLDRIESK